RAATGHGADAGLGKRGLTARSSHEARGDDPGLRGSVAGCHLRPAPVPVGRSVRVRLPRTAPMPDASCMPPLLPGGPPGRRNRLRFVMAMALAVALAGWPLAQAQAQTLWRDSAVG